MPDGKVLTEGKTGKGGVMVSYTSWQTTPMDVARTISQSLADNVSVAKITWGEKFEYSYAEDGMEGDDGMGDALAEAGVEVDSAAQSYVNKPELWDLNRPLVGHVEKMEFLKFEDDREAKTVFWHSSAHMLGEALEHIYGSYLTIGPPLAAGFYYDSFMGEGKSLAEENYKEVSLTQLTA